MVSFQRAGHLEGCGTHSKRHKDQVLHGFIVGGTQIVLGIVQVRTYVSGSGRHQIAVLKDFAEAARGLHGAKQGHRGFGRGVLEFKDPLEVLPRKARASANEMLKQNVACYDGIAELDFRIAFDNRFIPPDFALID